MPKIIKPTRLQCDACSRLRWSRVGPCDFFLCASSDAVSGRACWKPDDHPSFIPSFPNFPCIPDKDTCSLDAFCNIAVLSGQHIRVLNRVEELQKSGTPGKRELRRILGELLTKIFDSLTISKDDPEGETFLKNLEKHRNKVWKQGLKIFKESGNKTVEHAWWEIAMIEDSEFPLEIVSTCSRCESEDTITQARKFPWETLSVDPGMWQSDKVCPKCGQRIHVAAQSPSWPHVLCIEGEREELLREFFVLDSKGNPIRYDLVGVTAHFEKKKSFSTRAFLWEEKRTILADNIDGKFTQEKAMWSPSAGWRSGASMPSAYHWYYLQSDPQKEKNEILLRNETVHKFEETLKKRDIKKVQRKDVPLPLPEKKKYTKKKRSHSSKNKGPIYKVTFHYITGAHTFPFRKQGRKKKLLDANEPPKKRRKIHIPPSPNLNSAQSLFSPTPPRDDKSKLAAGTFVYASYGEPSGVYKAQIIERRHDDMYKIKWLGGDVGYLWKPRHELSPMPEFTGKPGDFVHVLTERNEYQKAKILRSLDPQRTYEVKCMTPNYSMTPEIFIRTRGDLRIY